MMEGQIDQVATVTCPSQQCCLWDCHRERQPDYCSVFHAHLAAAEVNAVVAPKSELTLDNSDKYEIAEKCVAARENDVATGIPLLAANILVTSPWLQPGTFNTDLHQGETERHWVFFYPSVSPPSQESTWKAYHTGKQVPGVDNITVKSWRQKSRGLGGLWLLEMFYRSGGEAVPLWSLCILRFKLAA